jgi:hypothetical protein
MRHVFITSLMVATLGLSIVGAGCGGATSNPEATPAGDLRVERTPTGISGTFTENGRTISFETFHGGPRPIEEGFGLEIDGRFVDVDGRPFITASGGHSLANSAWALDLEADDALGPVDDVMKRRADFLLARDAARALQASQYASTDEDDVALLVDLGLANTDADLELRTATTATTPTTDSDSTVTSEGAPANGPGLVTQALLACTATTPFVHTAEIRYKACCFHTGEHSGVTGRSYQNGVIFSTTPSYNHSFWPAVASTDPSMTTACPAWVSGCRSNANPKMFTFPSETYGGGGCSTPYAAVSGLCGVHVCNDDTYSEFWNIHLNQYLDWGVCYDCTLASTHPSCG